MFNHNDQQDEVAEHSLGRQRAHQSQARAQRQANIVRLYTLINGMFRWDSAEFVAFLRTTLKWTTLGSIGGLLAGTASAIFLISLAWATEFRIEHPDLLFLLPFTGFGMGWIYWRFGKNASLGNNLVIDEVNNNRSRIPLRMAPLVLLGTVATHLFGGSAGREGTAIQMGASLADGVRRLFNLNPTDRRLMIMAGIAGGFGSVFGVPAAGFVFGMEVQNVGRIRYEGIIPCLVASYIGDFTTRWLGAPHSHYPHMPETEIELALVAKVAIAGIAFGLTSMLFIELTHGIKHLLKKITPWPPFYPLLGGFAIILMSLVVGNRDYNGLSLDLIKYSVEGTGVVTLAFLLKLIFTATTLGSGYYGGEVTPLFVIGSTLGYTLGRLLGVEPAFLASIGLVAVFAGASNTPLACSIMGIELFGGGATLYLFLGCTTAYLASGHRGIYATQQLAYPKSFGFQVAEGADLEAIAQDHPGWLPPLPKLVTRLAGKSVRSAMSQKPIVILDSATLADALQQAIATGVRSLPVVNQECQVVGILTDNDLQRAGLPINLSVLSYLGKAALPTFLGDKGQVLVESVMSSPAQTIPQTANLQEAVEKLTAAGLKRMPVVDNNNYLVGIITRSDILRSILAVNFASVTNGHSEFDWHLRVGDIELEPVVSIEQTASIAKLVQQLRHANAKRIVVLDAEGHLVGFVAQSDLFTRLKQVEKQQILAILNGKLDPNTLALTQTVGDIMTSPVISVHQDSLAYYAMQILLESQIKRLPVVDDEGTVIGIVGRAGLLAGIL